MLVFSQLLLSRSTWFTQDEVNTLKADGINTVRIPVSGILTEMNAVTDV